MHFGVASTFMCKLGLTHRFEVTFEMLRFSVPRGLRHRAAPQARSYVIHREGTWYTYA